MSIVKESLRKLIAFSKQQQAHERRLRVAKGKSAETATDEAYQRVIGSLSSLLADDATSTKKVDRKK